MSIEKEVPVPENLVENYRKSDSALYNWFAVNTGKLCPTGLHVPTDAEWTILTTYLGGESVAGGKLKEAGTKHWDWPNSGATYSSSFTALPGGNRYFNGGFSFIGEHGYWWSSSGNGQFGPIFRFMTYTGYSSNSVSRSSTNMPNGYSVRCVRD